MEGLLPKENKSERAIWIFLALAGISPETSSGGECSIRLQEEDSWISFTCEATESTAVVEVPNIDIFFEPSCEMLTLVALSNITRGSLLHGRVRILPPGAARPQSPDLLQTVSQPQISPGAPKRDKKCVYCGISFSSLDTLTAHMSSYCSRRPQLIGQQQPSIDSMAVPSNNTGIQLAKSGSESSETCDQVVPTNAHPAFVWTDSISRQAPGKRTFTSSSGCGVASASQSSSLGFCFQRSPRQCESPPSKLGLPHSIAVSSDFSSIPLTSASATPVKSVLPSPLNAQFSGSVIPAGLFADVDITASGLATLAALASLGSRLQASSAYASSLPPAALGHQLQSTQLSPINASAQNSWPRRERSERTSPHLDTQRTVFCRGCQRFYSASIYQSHVGISRQLNELTAPGQSRQESGGGGSIIPIAELAESAKCLGLVLTAPLITDAGFIYVPVHAACGRQNLESDLEPRMNGGANMAGSGTTQRPFQSAEASGTSSYQKLIGPYPMPPRQPPEQHTVATPLDLRIAQQEQQLKQSGPSEDEGGMVAPASTEEGIRRAGDSSAAAASLRNSANEHQRTAQENQTSEGKNGSETPPAPLNVLLGLLSTILSGQRTSKQDSTVSTPISMPLPPSASSPGFTPDMLSILMSSLMSYILPGALGNAAPWFPHARLLASQQHSQAQQQLPPPPPVGGYSMEALEAALLQATNQVPISPVSMFQGGLLPCVPAAETTLSGPPHTTSEERSNQDVPPTQPPRPYLCTNCHTRFQAYSTFKVSKM
ncbi:unnamed protein product [Schistocephalus solidus]|uniref:C2H2-type domain-containing protein n=1 Tax=Schistocephalus solidus TaxID=70667 RepID=A0A183TKB9_SCHSO|nr:unnamed protein product [Schistocephalus solidus]